MIKFKSQINILWTLVDILDIFVFFNLSFIVVTFINLCIIALSIKSLLFYKKLDRFLKLQVYKLHNNRSFTQTQLALKLKLFRNEHHRTTSILIFSNRTIISKVLFTTFAFNMPYNACIQTLVILRRVSEMTMKFMFYTFMGQLSSVLALLLLIAKCNTSIYKCKRHIVILQYGLGRYQLRDKIHHLRFYELVHYKRDIGFSVGLFGVLTKRRLYGVSIRIRFNFIFNLKINFQCCLLYAGFILFLCKIVIIKFTK